MKQNVTSVKSAKEYQKSVNNFAKAANKELKDVLTSPFAGINYLNKIVSGKIGGGLLCEGLSVDNIKAIAKELKSIHGNRYAFIADLLTKDSKGRFCTVERSKSIPIWEHDLIDIVNGKYVYLRPMALGITVTKLFNVFASIVKNEASAKVAKAKSDEKSAKVAANMAIMKATVTKVFGEYANTLTDDEIKEKYNLIKAA